MSINNNADYIHAESRAPEHKSFVIYSDPFWLTSAADERRDAPFWLTSTALRTVETNSG